MRRLITLFALICYFFSLSGYANLPPQTRLLVLTDIHFDPFVACYKNNAQPCPLIQKLQAAEAKEWPRILAAEGVEKPAYRQDTNYTLLVSALHAAALAATTQKADYVLVLGDFLAHDFRHYYKRYSKDKSRSGYQRFVNKTFTFLTDEIADAFPALNVYMLVGNNDSYGNDYSSVPKGQFFHDMAQEWSGVIKNKTNQTAFQHQFTAGGYYAVNLNASMRLIMLNTVLFSNKVRGSAITQAANDELNWLHNELMAAKENNQHVILGMHIPEGIDVYSSLHIKLFTLVEFWQAAFAERFDAELQQFSAQITGIFAGHLHADWFQIRRFDNFHEIPILGTPAISPIFGNNPGFKIYSYDDHAAINDFVTYYYPLTNDDGWKEEYRFNHTYQPKCKTCAITQGIKALKPTGLLADVYRHFYSVSTNSQPITTQWYPYYWCVIHEHDAAHYRSCIAC